VTVAFLVGAAVGAEPASGRDPFALPATAVTLDNGLQVLLLEDHRTDTVALHLSYGVGARDEREGELGCAHLFEHLMFEGSANVPVDKFDEWLTAGGGQNNAFTSADETAYFETFPAGALDLALFLESDRMGFLDAGLVPENLENQQLVVLQERAEGYAEPNGRDLDTLDRLVFPPGHPYHHSVIGTVADIEGFDIDGVRQFWGRHYKPGNAVLALVGNFDADDALAKVRHWFSDVPGRGEAPRRAEPTGAPTGAPLASGVIEDDVEERTAYLVWETVPVGHPDEPALDVLASVLSNGRGTRLDDALYYRSDLASAVGAYPYAMDLTGVFTVYAASPDTPLAKLEAKIRKETDRIAAKPPSAAEVARAKRAIRGALLDALERVDGKAHRLVDCWKRSGTADCLGGEWARIDAVTPADLSRVAADHLGGEPFRLSNVPRGQAAAALPGPSGPAVTVELP
jgi:zinc protease